MSVRLLNCDLELDIRLLVEAGGIEPPSEDVQELAPTRLFRDLELAMHPRADELMQSQPI